MTILTDVWQKSEYGSGYEYKGKCEVGVDEGKYVLYIEVDGKRIALDLRAAKRIFNFLLND